MQPVNRRQFLGAASLTAVLRPERVLGANDRLGIAVVGCGGRGLLGEALQFERETNVQVIAVCDTWRQHREAAADAVQKASARAPEQFVHWQDLLARKDVDAMVFATPDHQHCTQLAAAVRAGKDVYMEKPLAMTMKELNDAFDAVKKSGRVVQMGTQVRSWAPSVAARSFVQSGGLGKIFKIEQSRNGSEPYWAPYSKRPVTEADVDWKAFLMHRKPRPFDPVQYAGWYGFREFSLGPHTGFMVHFIDLVNYVTGSKYPRSVTAMGGRYLWKEPFDCPDSIEVVLEYPENDFLVRYNTTFGTPANSFMKFFGTRGVLDATQWTKPWVVTGYGPARAQDGPLPEAETTHHMKNFFECVRSRNTPAAPIEAGHAHAVASLMAEASYVSGKRVTYDPAKRMIEELR